MIEEISWLKTRITEKDQEIENLKTKIEELTKPKEELEQWKEEIVRQQEERRNIQPQSEPEQEWIASVETNLHWYRVIRRTPLLRNPYEKAKIIMHLARATKLGS